jgi:hypothetical protein
MSVWYDEHWEKENAWQSPFFYFYLNEIDNSRFKRLFVSWNGTGALLRNTIYPDIPFHILHNEEDVIRDLAAYGRRKSWYRYLFSWSDVNGRIELRQNLYSYGLDLVRILDIFNEKKVHPPVLAQFGDNEVNLDFPLPLFSKWRYIDPKHHRKPVPIVMKLESERHYDGPLPVALKDDIPWDQKKDLAIYRGMMSGQNIQDRMLAEDYLLRDDNKYNLYEACMKVPRCKMVHNYYNSTLVDAKLTYVFYKFSHISDRKLVSPPMSIRDQLKYKIIISLEGNDVATGLKWNLLSNSVVLMPPPTKTTWALEKLLVPWIHYVPLSENVDNIEEMVQWILHHQDEAQQISRRATNFIHDLFLHADSERDNRLIMEEMALRYASLWFKS